MCVSLNNSIAEQLELGGHVASSVDALFKRLTNTGNGMVLHLQAIFLRVAVAFDGVFGFLVSRR